MVRPATDLSAESGRPPCSRLASPDASYFATCSYVVPSTASLPVTFNGATPSYIASWSDASIVAGVAAGTTTGPVVVIVAGQASNSVTFTVNSGTGAGLIDFASPADGEADGVAFDGKQFVRTGVTANAFKYLTAAQSSQNEVASPTRRAPHGLGAWRGPRCLNKPLTGPLTALQRPHGIFKSVRHSGLHRWN
jgi:hypothetical protein